MFKRTPTKRDIARSTFEQALMLQGIVDKRQPPALLPDRVRKAKDVNRATEHDEQSEVIRWWNDNCHAYALPEFALYAVPNAGKRGYMAAQELQLEGMRKGILDLGLDVARGIYHGMRVEMKANDGKLTKEQSAVMHFLSTQGYKTGVYWTAEDAIEAIKQYLENI